MFETGLDNVRAQLAAIVNKAPLPKSLTAPHHLIAKLLGADEARLQKKLASPYPDLPDRPNRMDFRVTQCEGSVQAQLVPCIAARADVLGG